jgi:hypothetical protein
MLESSQKICYIPYIYGMKGMLIGLLAGLAFFGKADAQITFKKIDTTMKVGSTGFKVSSRNKEIATNMASVRPIGFESPANETMNIPVRGRIAGVQVDDLNNDGIADLVMFIYNDSAARHGTVLVLMSEGNKEIKPCALPDPALEGKINTGYKGGDQFSMMEGTVLEKFPIYKTGDKDSIPTGGNRVVQYTIGRNETGGYKFSILRFYDTH